MSEVKNPSLGFSLSRYFSVVAVDLKAMQIVHILHIIDNVTKYSTVAVVKSEKKDNTTKTFLKN